jgi:hypothetical protein
VSPRRAGRRRAAEGYERTSPSGSWLRDDNRVIVTPMALPLPSPAPVVEILALAPNAPAFHCVVRREGAWELVWRLRAAYPSVSWQARRDTSPAEMPSRVLRRLPAACRSAEAGMSDWALDLLHQGEAAILKARTLSLRRPPRSALLAATGASR